MKVIRVLFFIGIALYLCSITLVSYQKAYINSKKYLACNKARLIGIYCEKFSFDHGRYPNIRDTNLDKRKLTSNDFFSVLFPKYCDDKRAFTVIGCGFAKDAKDKKVLTLVKKKNINEVKIESKYNLDSGENHWAYFDLGVKNLSLSREDYFSQYSSFPLLVDGFHERFHYARKTSNKLKNAKNIRYAGRVWDGKFAIVVFFDNSMKFMNLSPVKYTISPENKFVGDIFDFNWYELKNFLYNPK